MIALSANELAYMRAAVASLLPDTCHILTITRTTDNAGGWTDTAGTAYANVACRLDIPKPGSETMVNGSLTSFKSPTVTFAYDATVTEANQLKFGTTIYNVTSVNTDQSWKADVVCTVERVP